MRLRPARLLFSALLLVVFLSNELNAQTTASGGLTGVVTDPSLRRNPLWSNSRRDRVGDYPFATASHVAFQSAISLLSVNSERTIAVYVRSNRS